MTQTGTNITATVQPITSVDAARKVVQEIENLAFVGEHYVATRLEHDLWEGVLEAVAGCNAQAGYIAAAALETKKIDFPRTRLL